MAKATLINAKAPHAEYWLSGALFQGETRHLCAIMRRDRSWRLVWGLNAGQMRLYDDLSRHSPVAQHRQRVLRP